MLVCFFTFQIYIVIHLDLFIIKRPNDSLVVVSKGANSTEKLVEHESKKAQHMHLKTQKQQSMYTIDPR